MNHNYGDVLNTYDDIAFLSTHFAIVEHSAAVEEKLDKIHVANYIVLPYDFDSM